MLNGGHDITVDHNTIIQDGWTVVYADVAPISGMVFTNNIFPDYQWAIMGTNHAPGNDTIAAYFPGGVFQKNAMAGSDPGAYPPDNFYPPTLADVGFVNMAAHDYVLLAVSPCSRHATDGTDVGANNA
jgi:hypothetical protein